MAKKRKRAENGKGNYRVRPNGTIELRISYRDELDMLKRKSFSGKTEEECIAKAKEFCERKRKSIYGLDMNATIPDILMNRYNLDYKRNFVGEQGYARNLENLKIIEKSVIANVPIMDITELHMHYFLSDITKYSNSVIEKLYQMVRMAFTIAIDKKIIDRNIMNSRDLRCPKSNKPTKVVRGLTEKEQEILVKSIYQYKVPYGRSNYKLQLLIELFSGMRMGEINALKPEDIDFDKNIINVHSTVSKGLNRDFIKEGAKTSTGIREVPISNLLKPVLIQAIKVKKKNPEGLLFYDYNNKRVIATSNVNSFYKRLCDKCGIECLGQHALRHTFATRCIEADIPAIVLKKWLGHKDIHVTLDTYADVFDRMNHGAIEKLEQHMGEYEDKLNQVENAIGLYPKW